MPNVVVKQEYEIPTADRVTRDRPDFTFEQSPINVDVDVQATRVEGITIAHSTDPISSGEEYDSDWHATGEFVYVRGSVYSSASGTIYIEQSIDGETLNVQTTQEFIFTGGVYTGGFIEDIVAPYIRIRFDPTAAATTLRVWARLSME